MFQLRTRIHVPDEGIYVHASIRPCRERGGGGGGAYHPSLEVQAQGGRGQQREGMREG